MSQRDPPAPSTLLHGAPMSPRTPFFAPNAHIQFPRVLLEAHTWKAHVDTQALAPGVPFRIIGEIDLLTRGR